MSLIVNFVSPIQLIYFEDIRMVSGNVVMVDTDMC